MRATIFRIFSKSCNELPAQLEHFYSRRSATAPQMNKEGVPLINVGCHARNKQLGMLIGNSCMSTCHRIASLAQFHCCLLKYFQKELHNSIHFTQL